MSVPTVMLAQMAWNDPLDTHYARLRVYLLSLVVVLAVAAALWRGSCEGKVSRGLSGKVVGKHSEFRRGRAHSTAYVIDVEESPGKITTLFVSQREFERIPLFGEVVKEPGIGKPVICPSLEKQRAQNTVRSPQATTRPAARPPQVDLK